MSRSLRVSEALFESASADGALFSRSTAQQVEHWARLGRALEGADLDVDAAVRLFALGRVEDESALWKRKRARQADDIRKLEAGQAAQGDMVLFTGEQARRARVVNGPY